MTGDEPQLGGQHPHSGDEPCLGGEKARLQCTYCHKWYPDELDSIVEIKLVSFFTPNSVMICESCGKRYRATVGHTAPDIITGKWKVFVTINDLKFSCTDIIMRRIHDDR